MERLIFENALGEQIIFDKHGTYRWTQVDGLGGRVAVFQVAISPYQDGAMPIGTGYFESMPVSISFIIHADNVYDAIRELNAILNPKLGDGRLIYERNGIVRSMPRVRTRVLPSLPGGSSRGLRHQVSDVVFESYNPYFVDYAETEAEVTTGGLLFQFPLEITDNYEFDYINTQGTKVINSGDVDCPVTLVLDGPMSSPLEIINDTLSQKIVLSMPLLENERLVITTEIESINVVKTDVVTGEQTVAFEYLDVAETDFFYLAKGENVIRIFAGEAEVEQTLIKFRQYYVGI